MIIFGDSIAKGVGVQEGSSWADLLADGEEKVRSFAEDGEIVEGTLAKVRELKLSSAGETVIIATGTNNCGLITNQESGESMEPDLKSFSASFEELLSLAKLKFGRTVVVGLVPSDGTVMPLGGEAIVSYDNTTIKEFNKAIRELCTKTDVPFADVLPRLSKHKRSLLADHIHPNADGHQIIFDELKRFLN